jgi:hypothetical protein
VSRAMAGGVVDYISGILLYGWRSYS